MGGKLSQFDQSKINWFTIIIGSLLFAYHAFGKVLGNAPNIMGKGEEGILFLKCPSNKKEKINKCCITCPPCTLKKIGVGLYEQLYVRKITLYYLAAL